jgi:very-short-patch-repair endonuclease
MLVKNWLLSPQELERSGMRIAPPLATSVYSAFGFVVCPQVSIAGYRVDFFAAYQNCSDRVGGLIVEIDGHEFHEKTKDQVSRDKSRERALQAEGYRVFRYSGSDVWRSPFECADEVLQTLIGAIGEIDGKLQPEARP